MVRAPTYDENGRKKGAWSKEEDDKLRAYILKYGHWNWSQLPKFAGLSRCGKSCRLRWMNYLRPNLKHGNYTKEEEDMIIKLHEQHGNKWSLIAAKLSGRTDNDIKNYWHTHLKKSKKKDPTSMKEQSNGTSKRKAGRTGEAESENSLVDTPILESSPFSSSTSAAELPSLSSDHALNVSGLNWPGLMSREPYEYSIGDFWTQPFVSDDTYNHNSYSSSSTNEGLVLQNGSYYEDNLDLIYHVMQDMAVIDLDYNYYYAA